jgi:hypothetical protein
MEAKQIIENNKLIAMFMGAVPDTDELSEWWGGITFPHGYDRTLALKYHSSWDWLMPVVEKIENFSTGGEGYEYGHAVIVNNWSVDIKDMLNGELRVSICPSSTKINSKIEAVYLAVVEFIKWYNKSKLENNEDID